MNSSKTESESQKSVESTKKRDKKAAEKMGDFFNKTYHTVNERNPDYFFCEKQNK